MHLLQHLVNDRKCVIPDGVIRCSFYLADISRSDVNDHIFKFQNAVEAVVDQSKTLRKKGALLVR